MCDDERNHRQEVDFRQYQTAYTVIFRQDFTGVTVWKKEPEKDSVLVGLHDVLGEDQINRWKLAIAARSPDRASQVGEYHLANWELQRRHSHD